MTPLRKERVGHTYPSTFHLWRDQTPPHAPFKNEKCQQCGLNKRRTWGAKLCKCNTDKIFEKEA